MAAVGGFLVLPGYCHPLFRLMADYDPLCCAHCGGSRIGSIQRGIDNLWIGLCHDCAPKKTALPPETDGSKKAVEQRARVIKEAANKAYRTVLTPLVERSKYAPRVKPVEAKPESLWDDTLP